MADALEFDFTAQVSDLLSGLEAAQDSMQETMGTMSAQIDQVSAKLDSALPAAAKHAASSLKEVSDEGVNVGESFDKLQQTLAGVFEATGIALLYEGLERASEAIAKMGERAQSLLTMANVIGVSTNELQGMQAAAEEAGVSTEQFDRATERLINLLNQAKEGTPEAVAALRGMGVSLDQIQSNNFGIIQLLQQLHTNLNQSGTAIATQAELLKELGVRGAAVTQVYKDFSFQTDDLAKKTRDLGAPTEAQLKNVSALGTAIHELGSEMGNTATKMTSGFIDFFKSMAAAQGDSIPGLMDDTTLAKQDAIQTQLKTLTVNVQSIITAASLESEKAQVEAAQEGSTQRAALAKALYADTVDLYGQTNAESVKAYHEMTEAATQYTEGVLKQEEKLEQLTSAAKMRTLQAAQRANEEELTADIDRITKEQAADDAAVKTTLATTLAGLAQQQKGIESAYEQHKITNSQELQDTINTMQAELSARMTAYEQMEKIYANDPEMMRKIYSEEAAAQETYLAGLSSAQNKYAQQQTKQWQGLVNSMTSQFSSGITKMIEGTETFQKFTQNLFSTLFEQLISMMVKWVANWIEQQIVGMIANKATAVAQVTTNAGVAASGAMASVAMIPYVGWAMAPEIGAATYAEAMAVGLPSAAGGWEVPYDTMAMVHKDEKILPAKFSSGLENMINTGGGGGQTHNYHGSMNFNGVSDDWLRKQLTSPRGRTTLFRAAGQAVGRGVRVRR